MFLDRADIEATNYPAEQDILGGIAVVNRKTEIAEAATSTA